jgi:flavodoxin
MKALVVYDSAFGNTEKIAQAIADALGAQVRRVADVRPEHVEGLDLLVVGSPTQKFRPLGTITSFLKDIPAGGLEGVKVAAFDTRIPPDQVEAIRILAFFVRLFGYAAEPIEKRLEKKGGEPVVSPEGFYVEDTEGPLRNGELERAADWARQIAGTAG